MAGRACHRPDPVTYHHRMSYARDERAALSDLLDQTGPAEPTLCEGWNTGDLAAHLVLRESRPDTSAGVMGGPLAGYTRRAQRKLSSRVPYGQLVARFRGGPPRLSVFALPGMDDRANVVEFFTHHEDVRRGQPGWEPRKLDTGLADDLWARLKMARFLLRKAPVGVEFARDDQVPGGAAGGPPAVVGGDPPRVRITARARTPLVTVTGAPAELTLWALGRTSAAQVRLDGSEAAV
ncbi:MAG: TIGR03085 family metal-binding protein, partial [Actinomycetota bacterium]